MCQEVRTFFEALLNMNPKHKREREKEIMKPLKAIEKSRIDEIADILSQAIDRSMRSKNPLNTMYSEQELLDFSWNQSASRANVCDQSSEDNETINR